MSIKRGPGAVVRHQEGDNDILSCGSPMMDAARDEATAVISTLCRKNADYGDSFSLSRDEFGFDAFLVRASDKWNRMKTLRNRAGSVSDESLEDTIRDMIGYCLLELAYRATHTKRIATDAE